MFDDLLSDKKLKPILRFLFIVVVLSTFTKLSLDAIILGSIAIFLYLKR